VFLIFSDEFKNSKERDLAYSKETKIDDLDNNAELDAADTIPLTISDPRQFFGGADESKGKRVEKQPLLSASKSKLSEVLFVYFNFAS
jgi:hypothetical protein